MVDYRSILRLHSQGNSQREIARELFCSRHTISDVPIQAMTVGITWPLDDDVSNEDIQEIRKRYPIYGQIPPLHALFQGDRFDEMYRR